MNQAEAISDSDSSTSSSWIFVDDCEVQSETDKNKYYLNCSSEPVQELTSQCLHTANSEQETDSDGISIISESDDSKENSLPEEQQDCAIENIAHHKYTELGNEYYFNKYIVLLWIIIAVTTPLLLNYFSTYGETISVIRNKIDVSRKGAVDKERKFQENGDQILETFDHELIDVKNNEVQKAKKKYDSKGEVDVHRLNCKHREHLCDKFKELKEKIDGKNKKGEFVKDVRYDFMKKLSKQKDNLKSSLVNEGELVIKTDKHDSHEIIKEKQGKKKLKNENENSLSEGNEMQQKQKGRKKKNRRKESELKGDNYIKKKNKNKGEHPKHRKNKKIKEENGKHIPDEEDPYYKEVKKLKKILQNKDKDIKKLKKLVKTKDKQLRMMEYKILRELNMIRKSERIGNQFLKNMENKESYNSEVNSTAGDWYHKLYEGRSKFRKQQHASDWVFDRADFRSRKRNVKNNWYWNRMTDTEQIHPKKGFWQSDWMFDPVNFRSKKRNLKNNWYWNWMTDREQLRLKKGFWQFIY